MQSGQVGDEIRRRAEGAVWSAITFPYQEAVLLQLLQPALDRRVTIAATAGDVGHGHPPAIPMRGEQSEQTLRLEGQPRAAEESVGNLGELIGRHHTPADPRREAAGTLGLQGCGHQVRFVQRDAQEGRAVRDAVDDLAESAVRAAQTFTDQVAARLEFLQSGAYRFPPVRTQADEVVDRHLPAVPVRADVSEDPFRLVGEPGVPEQPVGDLGELISRHHTPADAFPETAHRRTAEAGRLRWPGQHTEPAEVRRPAGLSAQACVCSTPSAHPPTPTRLTATSPDHRSRSDNTAV